MPNTALPNERRYSVEPIELTPGQRFGRLIFVGIIPPQPGFEDGGFDLVCASCDSQVFRTSLFVVPGDSTKEWQACDSCVAKLRFRRSFSYTLRKWDRFLSEGKGYIACKQLSQILKRLGISPRRMYLPHTRRRGYSHDEVMSRIRHPKFNSHTVRQQNET
jgi:hypothetical protein